MSEKTLDDIKKTIADRPSFSFKDWLWPFCLNDKFKFASKVALSLTLAYLIPMAMGWPQASTAAITVMLIASISSQRESLAKGTFRVIGTIIGAVIGLLLVGLFVQDRLLYMLAVSIIVSIIFYIRNAYRKDPTLFMLTGVMVLMMSNGGDAEGAFLYGVDRAFMTSFGVVVYTLVGVFIFPTKVEQNLQQLANKLNTLQLTLFKRITATSASKDEMSDKALIQQLFAAQNALQERYALLSNEYTEVSAYKKEWDLALHYYQQITQLLVSVAESNQGQTIDSERFIVDYSNTLANIEALFEATQTAWQHQNKQPVLAPSHKIVFNEAALTDCPHLQKGRLITFGYLLNSLQQKLANLVVTIRCIDSVTGRASFKEAMPKKPSMFLWWDAENAKTAVKVFVGYWIAGIIWIYFNPPGGYNFVIFTAIFISLLSFLPIHPAMLFVLFTFGFLFAVPSYVFLLPQLSLGAELGVFIFIYTFIAFYLFKGPITIFFLLGLFILGIDNTMTYHFGIIMTIMLLFYLVVFMTVVSYYVPFSSKPEHLFCVMKARFFRHVSGVLRFNRYANASSTYSRLNYLRYQWHAITMRETVNKLILWSSKINYAYFDQTQPEQLKAFTEACNLLKNQLNTFEMAEQNLLNNGLVKKAEAAYYKKQFNESVVQLTQGFACAITADALNKRFNAYYTDYQDVESKLDAFINNIDFDRYSHSDIAGFYILLHLKKNVFDAISQCKASYEDINWAHLRQTRF